MNKIESPEESRKALDKIISDLTRSITKKDELTRFWFFILIMFAGVGIWGWIIQIKNGLGVTGMGDYVSWGLYLANFVFFVAVSLVGLLISSVLQLLKLSWAKPITRAAEQIAIAAVGLAGIVIVMDMGRPDRLLNVFFHGRFASPIVWDLTVVGTYLAISILLFYLPLIPDMALLRDRPAPGIPQWKLKLYKILALGWKGNEKQYRTVAHALRVLMILIIPIGLTIHTVTSWLFAATLRPGWDSTIFGPYFVIGAFVAGTAALIVLMYVYRLRYGLKDYFEDLHFDNMGKLLVLVCLVYLYFNINEFLVPGYKMKLADGIHLETLFTGKYCLPFLVCADCWTGSSHPTDRTEILPETPAPGHNFTGGPCMCLVQKVFNCHSHPGASLPARAECAGTFPSLSTHQYRGDDHALLILCFSPHHFDSG